MDGSEIRGTGSVVGRGMDGPDRECAPQPYAAIVKVAVYIRTWLQHRLSAVIQTRIFGLRGMDLPPCPGSVSATLDM